MALPVLIFDLLNPVRTRLRVLDTSKHLIIKQGHGIMPRHDIARGMQYLHSQQPPVLRQGESKRSFGFLVGASWLTDNMPAVIAVWRIRCAICQIK